MRINLDDYTKQELFYKLLQVLGDQYQNEIDNLFIDIYHRVLADRFSIDDVEELANNHNSDVVNNYYDMLGKLEDTEEED